MHLDFGIARGAFFTVNTFFSLQLPMTMSIVSTAFAADQPAHFTLGSCDENYRKTQHRQCKDDPQDRNYHEARERN